MSVLTLYIKAENKKSQAKMDANEGWFIGMLDETVEWWAERDVHTVEDFKRWEFESVMSDIAKDAYGTRSACPDTSDMNLEELEACYNQLCNAAEQAADEEREWQNQSIVEFEAAITNAIAIGAGDRENAIKWLRDAEGDEDCQHDDNYFEYSNNLPYGYLNGKRPGWLA